MKLKVDDYTFAILAWSLVLGPAALALINWSGWYLLLYLVSAFIFGMA